MFRSIWAQNKIYPFDFLAPYAHISIRTRKKIAVKDF